ncbi:hypothetical protein ACFOTA_06230 [Chitinophaga sp. GCM10012297]|uniref:Uncharacterized protein n=1 Tax=Chitinophaga chungangae TaxID=2821488 RepID=A0ABS3YAW6_9BACT|nr:hypothetical protein [Chitinophaga chungangae]MBO9151796.1 hypothetical protein [Chitinophaga chungangae]
MAKSRDGNFIPPKGKPSGNNREENADFREDLRETDADLSNVHVMHPNRNVSKGEEETLADQQPEYITYKQQSDTLQQSQEAARVEPFGQVFSREDLLQLARHQSPRSVSIYMPTHRSGVAVNELQDMVLFKNALQQVEQELQEKGLPANEISSLLAGGFDLAKDEQFWHSQQDGLAVFIAPGVTRYMQLPYPVGSLVYVQETFYVSPLLGLLQGRERFYLLALSKSKATLYEGDGWGMHEVPVPEMPHGIDDVVHFEEKDDQKLFRTGGRGAGEGANYHGIGAGKPDEKENISMYMDEVDETLWAKRLSVENVPLLLAGVDYLIPIFKQRSRYRHIHDGHLSGNFERENAGTMFEKARPLMQPHFEQSFNQALERYHNNRATGLTSSSPEDVIPACYYARVEIVFVRKDCLLWGTFDEQNNRLMLSEERQNDDACMLNAAVSKALQTGATVFATEAEYMPDGAMIAALMRY